MNRLSLIIFGSTILIVVTYITIDFFNERRNAQIVKSNYKVVPGKIIDFDDNRNSDLGGVKLTYSFEVGNKKYTREVNPRYRIPGCDQDVNSTECQGKRFWVIYSPSNPEISLIDLSHEISNYSDSVFGTLVNFQ